MRKTFPLHVLAQLETSRPVTMPVSSEEAPRSRRRRSVKSSKAESTIVVKQGPAAKAFDRLTVSLQPELDAFDLAWTG